MLETGPFNDGRGGYYADCSVADRWGQTEREAIDALVLYLEQEVQRLQAEVDLLKAQIERLEEIARGDD